MTESGFNLGVWLKTQKTRLRKGECTAEQRRLLGEAGVELNLPSNEEIWENNFIAAKKFYEEKGNLFVPKSYKTADGILLHSWLNNQKNNYKLGKLSEEKADMLRLIGINFNISKNNLIWEKNFNAASDYYSIYGNLDVPNPYKIDGNFDLGDWIYRQRRNRAELSDEQIKKLDSIGMIWTKRSATKKSVGTGMEINQHIQ